MGEGEPEPHIRVAVVGSIRIPVAVGSPKVDGLVVPATAMVLATGTAFLGSGTQIGIITDIGLPFQNLN